MNFIPSLREGHILMRAFGYFLKIGVLFLWNKLGAKISPPYCRLNPMNLAY